MSDSPGPRLPVPDGAVEVSVVVLAYNHGPYIATCLDGLLAQDFGGRVEILVGEDHSTDDTLEIVQSYAQQHPQIRLITSGANVGMFLNHRRTLAATTGTFVAYCEGDDYWHRSDKLARQVEFLDRHPDLSGVFTDVDHMIRRGRSWVHLRSYWSTLLGDQPAITTFEDLLVRNTVQTCSILLRGDLARSFLGSPYADGGYAVDDWPLFLHMTETAPLGRLNESFATYRRVPGSATNNGAANNERRISDQFRLIDDASRLTGYTGPARALGMTTTRDALVGNALVAGDRDMVRRALTAGASWGVPPDARARRMNALLAVPTLHALTRLFHWTTQRVSERVRYR